jgi:hypothetical protein
MEQSISLTRTTRHTKVRKGLSESLSKSRHFGGVADTGAQVEFGCWETSGRQVSGAMLHSNFIIYSCPYIYTCIQGGSKSLKFAGIWNCRDIESLSACRYLSSLGRYVHIPVSKIGYLAGTNQCPSNSPLITVALQQNGPLGWTQFDPSFRVHCSTRPTLPDTAIPSGGLCQHEFPEQEKRLGCEEYPASGIHHQPDVCFSKDQRQSSFPTSAIALHIMKLLHWMTRRPIPPRRHRWHRRHVPARVLLHNNRIGK